jgi:hypothetical protein
MAILEIIENYDSGSITARLICPRDDSDKSNFYKQEDVQEMIKDVAVPLSSQTHVIGLSSQTHMTEKHLAIVNWHLDRGFTFIAPGLKGPWGNIITTRIYMRMPTEPNIES